MVAGPLSNSIGFHISGEWFANINSTKQIEMPDMATP